MRNTFLLALLALLLLWLVLHHEHTERDNTEVLEVKKKSSLISTSSSKEKREHTIVCIKEIILLRGSRFLLIGISSRNSQRALESIPILSLFFHNLLVLLICVASFSLFLFLLLQFLHMKKKRKKQIHLWTASLNQVQSWLPCLLRNGNRQQHHTLFIILIGRLTLLFTKVARSLLQQLDVLFTQFGRVLHMAVTIRNIRFHYHYYHSLHHWQYIDRYPHYQNQGRSCCPSSWTWCFSKDSTHSNAITHFDSMHRPKTEQLYLILLVPTEFYIGLTEDRGLHIVVRSIVQRHISAFIHNI